ncbi:hypothetical protein WKW80_35210 [Variovorax humicola]|uniref:Lipoprotein n=1 Tax=Variovorax humicola TaxID=1769758 RepID=A0ABU8WAU9_9BURK
MKSLLKALFISVALMACSEAAIACKRIVLTRLTFVENAIDLDATQLEKLAVFINAANEAYARYSEVTIEGTASVRTPGQTLSEARQTAKLRAANVARAYQQLQPNKIKLTTLSEIYAENGDFVYVQFHIDYDALKLPDCNPVPIDPRH